MPDAISVCNQALGELSSTLIASFDDGTSVSTLCGEHYPSARDQTLELHPWNWSMRRVWLARLADAPPFGWCYQYGLPPDYIKARGTDQDATWFGLPGYAIEMNDQEHLVLVSQHERVGLIYTARVENLNVWSPLALQVLAKVLAARLAKPITGQNSTKELLLKEAMAMLPEAKRSDGREGTPPVLRLSGHLVAGRRGGYGGAPRYPRSYTVNGGPHD